MGKILDDFCGFLRGNIAHDGGCWCLGRLDEVALQGNSWPLWRQMKADD